MARSALITDIKRQDNSHLAKLPCKNANLSPGSPNRCGRGLGREKYVKGEGKSFRYAGVGYLIGDCLKTKDVFGGGQKITFEGIVEMMMKAVLVTFFSSTSGKVDKDNKGVIEDAPMAS